MSNVKDIINDFASNEIINNYLDYIEYNRDIIVLKIPVDFFTKINNTDEKRFNNTEHNDETYISIKEMNLVLYFNEDFKYNTLSSSDEDDKKYIVESDYILYPSSYILMTKKDIDNADDYYNLIRELNDKSFISKKAYEHIVRTIKYSFTEDSIEHICENIKETIIELKNKWDKFETKVEDYKNKLNELQNYLDDVDEEILG
jgi:hypothetical protein